MRVLAEIAPPTRPRLLGPALAVLCAFAVLVGLGAWQLERKAWKDDLVQTMTVRLSLPPVEIPARERWRHLDAAEDEFRSVTARLAFMYDREGLVYTAGSSLRNGRPTGPGYWVFTPALLADGTVVVVNRGFVPEGRQDQKNYAGSQAAGIVEITGIMRWPEERIVFTPNDDPKKNLWFVRDHIAIAAAKNLGEVAPFYVAQVTPAHAGGMPRTGPLSASLPNNHLQYAVTWFGLAAVLIAVFAVWARSRRRGIY